MKKDTYEIHAVQEGLVITPTEYALRNTLEALRGLIREYEGYFEGAPEPKQLVSARKAVTEGEQVLLNLETGL